MRKFFKLFLIVVLAGGFFYWPNLITAEELGDNSVVQNEENNPEEGINSSQNEEEIISETEEEIGAPQIEEGDLVINEFMVKPKDGEEWIEIYNTSNKDFDLDDCEIRDAKNNKFGLLSGIIENDNYLVINDSRVLNDSGGDVIILNCGGNQIDRVAYGTKDDEIPVSPKEEESIGRIPDGKGKFMILEIPTKGEINNHPPIAIAAIVGSNQEVFAGEEVVFSGEESSDKDGDDLIFSWDFGDGMKASGVEVSHNYTNTGTFTVTLTVSDGELENSDTLTVKVNKIVYSDKIVINEFLPDPEGDDAVGEFIELYNNSDSDVDLKNWKIGDNTTKRYVFSSDTISDTIIEAGNYKVVYYSASKIVLNNTGDSVRLFQPDGNLLESISYDKSKTGFSYNRTENGWKWSLKLTPDAKNIIEESDEDEEVEAELDEEPKEVSITEAKKLEKGVKVKIEGIVSVAPGIFSDHIFYLSGSGIQIYSYIGDFPGLKIGDKISLIGFVSGYGNEMRIRIVSTDDIKILKHEKAPTPHKIKTGEVAEKWEGSLVEVSGEVSKKQGNNIYINDGSGEARIYIDEDTGIDKSEIKKGDFVVITGIVSETSSGYRILPRFQEDIKIVKGAATVAAVEKKVKSNAKKKLPATGGNIFEPIIAGFILNSFLFTFLRKKTTIKI